MKGVAQCGALFAVARIPRLAKPRDSFALRHESISEFRCREPHPLVTTDSAIHSLGGTGCSSDQTDGHQDDQERMLATGKVGLLICCGTWYIQASQPCLKRDCDAQPGCWGVPFRDARTPVSADFLRSNRQIITIWRMGTLLRVNTLTGQPEHSNKADRPIKNGMREALNDTRKMGTTA